MQPYGNKKLKSYGEITGKPSCECCNGKYAKIGKHWRRKTRGLKKTARQKYKNIDPYEDFVARSDLQAVIQNDEILREDLNDSFAEEIKEELEAGTYFKEI